MGSSPEQLVPVVGCQSTIALFLELIELHAIGSEIGAEVLQAFDSLVFPLLIWLISR